MRRFYVLVLLWSIAFIGCDRSDKNVYLNPKKAGDYAVRIRIPDAWIEKVRGFAYTRKTQPLLLHEFETVIKPDTIYNPRTENKIKRANS